MVTGMRDGCGFGGIGRRSALSMLALVAVLLVAIEAARDIGLCIVFRLARRAVPGCVPAWSADRAPPRRAVTV
ncbi:hypothetical protein GCM10009827_069460 [Dactylosporangium maewongense]|uniref:Uncharacterized protein n=2 Tax=Micromonosporaceae TaxID=28056 RepID=A0ABP4M9V3_9ACTN